MTVAPAERIKAPELRGNNLALGWCREREVYLDGPAGCVAGETRIYNPVTGERTPIKELYEKKVAPIVQTLMGAMQAEVPFRKGVRKLYRVTLASGLQCVVTDNHLFLTPEGWRFASSCLPSQRLLVSSPSLPVSISESGLLVSQQDALRLSQIPLGSQEYYSVYSRPYDEQLQLEAGSDQAAVPPQDGAHERIRVDLCGHDRDSLSEYSHQGQQSDRHARMCYSPSLDDRACTLSDAQQGTSSRVDVLSRSDVQSPREKVPLSPIAQSLLCGDSKFRRELWSTGYSALLASSIHGDRECQVAQRLEPRFWSADKMQKLPVSVHPLDACSLSNLSSNVDLLVDKYNYTVQWDTVSSIEYERTDEYFDLHVPVAEHYLAEGIWHHNTGKTVAALYKIHRLLSHYPGSRALVARKTNTALSGSAMVTYRDNILRTRRDIRWFGGNKVEPAAYRYPNGSEMIVNGLDKPEKVLSAEFDWGYINETPECDEEDIEFVRMRLRPRTGGPDVPYRQLVMDGNPGPPTHWLNQRMIAGRTHRLVSRHEDNPRYFDSKLNDWTPEGHEYIEGILGGLTGVRLARYRYGIWAAAEGTVYEDSYDRARNVIKRFEIPMEWPRYMSLDFGYTHPFVAKWYAEDPDGRAYCYREIYMTKRLVEEHAKQVKALSRWGEKGGDSLPRAIYADHDAEGRATFERYTGLFTTPAHKAVSEGIQAVAARLRLAGDGKPRMFYFEDCLVERDSELVKLKLPTCTIEEFDCYIWDIRAGQKKGDQPVKEFDHGQDTDRYYAAGRDLTPGNVSYYRDIWR